MGPGIPNFSIPDSGIENSILGLQSPLCALILLWDFGVT